MSQLILDEHVDLPRVLPLLQRWITVQRLHDLRPNERVLDDRVPEILRTLKQPTFVTIDRGFWHRRWCDPSYAMVYCALREDQQEQIPDLLRALLRRPEFQTRARRMGKVTRVSTAAVDYWEFSSPELHHLDWQAARRKR